MPLMSREGFLNQLRAALEARRGYATGKLGSSEVQRLNFSIAAARLGNDSPVLHVLKHNLIYHSLTQAGLFPPEAQFYLRFNALCGEHLQTFDCVGIFPELRQKMQPLIEFYQWHMPLVNYLDQEPDRSMPCNEANCYLPFFRDKRILFISSYAELLRERATRETFEKVWARTGKPWFYPASVDALEFPFGYTAATHAKYASSLEVLDEVTTALGEREFDVALIAAGGLASPIAGYVKQLGKVGISLGGHLQALFGIAGKRWRENAEYRTRYINEDWIDMPERYRIPETNVGDGGAYW